MKTAGRSLVLVLALASATASFTSSASAYGHGGSSYACKRYCSSWGWCGWGNNKYKCCKAWSCH